MWKQILWALDWLGRIQAAQWIVALLTGATVTGVVAALSTAPLWALVLLFSAFSLVALGIFIAWQNYRLLKASPYPTTTTKMSDETENERFHNQRSAPLKIEFSNDNTFKHIGSPEGHGLRNGKLQIYRVAVLNTTEKSLNSVQVWLTDITPRPSELMGQGALPLHVTHEVTGSNAVMLASGEKRFIDVVSYFDRFWNPNISIEHTSSAAKREIYEGDDGYEIELMAKGENAWPFKRRFKIGVQNKELYMRSLDQPEQEAFEEGFKSESENV